MEGSESEITMTVVTMSCFHGQVQVEVDERFRGSLLSMGRMLSLPCDSYTQPLRCSPYPAIGLEAYSYSYSGINAGRRTQRLYSSQRSEWTKSPAFKCFTLNKEVLRVKC